MAEGYPHGRVLTLLETSSGGGLISALTMNAFLPLPDCHLQGYKR